MWVIFHGLMDHTQTTWCTGPISSGIVNIYWKGDAFIRNELICIIIPSCWVKNTLWDTFTFHVGPIARVNDSSLRGHLQISTMPIGACKMLSTFLCLLYIAWALHLIYLVCARTTSILSSPPWDLLQNSPVREYTWPAQSLHCTLTITAIFNTPNESHEPAWL